MFWWNSHATTGVLLIKVHRRRPEPWRGPVGDHRLVIYGVGSYDDFMNTGDKGASGQRNYKGDREKVGRRGPAKKGN